MNNQAWFILQPQYTVREYLQMHFKVAVRNFHAFIQAVNSLIDVSAHYQHAG